MVSKIFVIVCGTIIVYALFLAGLDEWRERRIRKRNKEEENRYNERRGE